jgi:type IX secretion system PorP/SprF family membrane protein
MKMKFPQIKTIQVPIFLIKKLLTVKSLYSYSLTSQCLRMKLKNLLLFLFFLFAISGINAQDFHYSQYNLSPLTLNPAKAGSFKGTVRLGGIYRDQWGSVLQNQYRTPSFYVDAPVYRGIGKKDWIGVGAHFLNDQSGTYGYTQTNLGAAISYHLALDAMRKNVLTFGFQASQNQRRVDVANLRFYNQYVDGAWTPATENVQENVQFTDYAAGIDFRARPSAKLSWNVGFSAFHLLEPTESNNGTATAIIPRRLVGYAGATASLTPEWQLTPQVFYTNQGGSSEIIAQAIAGYKLGASKDFLLNMGLGYRVGDAAMLIVGMEFKNLVVGASYDFNVSGLSTYSNYQGGFEVGLGYIIRIPKTPNIPPVIFNPRF